MATDEPGHHPLPRCRRVIDADATTDAVDETIVDRITLDETARHRRRTRLVSDRGIAFLLDLEDARLLAQGDRLCLDDGRVIGVRAAAERLLAVRGRDPHHLLRLTWHMGNRHLPTEIRDDHLRIRHDHVIAAMLCELGAELAELEAPFDPEGGAYAKGHHDHVHTANRAANPAEAHAAADAEAHGHGKAAPTEDRDASASPHENAEHEMPRRGPGTDFPV